MIVELKIPGAGESVTEAAIGSWLVEDGSIVEKDQEIAEVETDKATLPLISPEKGKLKIVASAGQKIQVGEVACTIDTASVKDEPGKKTEKVKAREAALPKSVTEATSEEHRQPPQPEKLLIVEEIREKGILEKKHEETSGVKVTPLARNIMDKNNLGVEDIVNGLRKITRSDVEQVLNTPSAEMHTEKKPTDNRVTEKNPMSPLRRKLSKRLVAVKNETAMLTTFNEVDMSNIIELRKKYQSGFQEKYGQKLGMVSFFAKACTKALIEFPRVNSFLEGEDIITPHYVDISIAVQTDKGLMAPVIRNAQSMNIAQIEHSINDLASKARNSKLSIDELTGGTFTITNGGVFGSMLSTPILNPPQSAILGMHNIVERAVVIKGRIEIRPIMFVALSYDHRIIDGRDSVTFLVRIKELIESPLKMLIEKNDPEKQLLGL